MSTIDDKSVPTLTFNPADLPLPATPHNLGETARDLHNMGGWIGCYDALAGRALELAAGGLMLVSVFSFGRSTRTPAQRALMCEYRRKLASAQKVMRNPAKKLAWLRAMGVACALLFGGCAPSFALEPGDVGSPASGTESAPASRPSSVDAPGTPASGSDLTSAPDIRDALADAIDAWEGAGLPVDTNCPALYMVSVRARDEAEFTSGRFCLFAKGTDSRACFRPIEGELVFAPGAAPELGPLVKRAFDDGMARCTR